MWKHILYNSTKISPLTMLECNMGIKEINEFFCDNPSWKDIFKSWSKINKETCNHLNAIMCQTIWYNHEMGTTFYPKIHALGVWQIKDICIKKDDGYLDICSYEEFCQKNQCEASFLEYFRIISKIPKRWKSTIRQSTKNLGYFKNTPESWLDKCSVVEKATKWAYQTILYKIGHIDKARIHGTLCYALIWVFPNGKG